MSAPPVGEAPYYSSFTIQQGAVKALGYLHANCGSCHNSFNEGLGGGLNLSLEVAQLNNLDDTSTYQTTVIGMAAASNRAVPGDPDASRIVQRMLSRPGGMPPVASDEVDTVGLDVVRFWMCGLAAGSPGCDGIVVSPPSNFAGMVVAMPPVPTLGRLTWILNPSAEAYEISRDGVVIFLTANNRFDDIGLDPMTTYNYSIVAVDNLGNRSLPSTVSVTTGSL